MCLYVCLWCVVYLCIPPSYQSNSIHSHIKSINRSIHPPIHLLYSPACWSVWPQPTTDAYQHPTPIPHPYNEIKNTRPTIIYSIPHPYNQIQAHAPSPSHQRVGRSVLGAGAQDSQVPERVELDHVRGDPPCVNFGFVVVFRQKVVCVRACGGLLLLCACVTV
jgi:hypothetical protein